MLVGMGTRFERILLWVLFPIIIVDMIVHRESWDDFYDDHDPTWFEYGEINDVGN